MLTYTDKDGNTRSYNGPGCRFCPVKNCSTLRYRGSACAAQRAEYGLDDPITKAESLVSKIQMMSEEELMVFLEEWINQQKENVNG